MAGAGFDASMIQQADGTLKDRLGRVAYVWTGSKNLRAKPFKAKIAVDGAPWYAGRGELHPRRQRRSPLRRRRGVRGRTARTTAGSRSASSTPTASSTGCGRSPALRSATPERSPLVQATTRDEDQGQARTARCSTRSTAAIGRRSSRSRSTSSPRAITICLPEGGVGTQWQRRGPNSVSLGRAPFGRRGIRQLASLRDPLAGRFCRACACLWDHRPAGVRARRRPRRQDHEPAGRAANRSSSIRSVTSCSRCWRSGSAATRSGGCSAPSSATAARAPTSGIERARRPRQRHRLRADVRRRGPDPAGPAARPGGNAKKTTSDVFGWPAGRWLVGDRGRSCWRRRRLPVHPRRSNRSSSTTRRPSRCRARSRRGSRSLGTVGHVARAVVFGAGRRLPRQGGLSTTRRTRRSASTAHLRSSTTARTGRGCSARSPPG